MDANVALIATLLLVSLAIVPACQAADTITAVPFTDVKITDNFWAPRIETNRKATVWYDVQKCEETGPIANFDACTIGGVRVSVWASRQWQRDTLRGVRP